MTLFEIAENNIDQSRRASIDMNVEIRRHIDDMSCADNALSCLVIVLAEFASRTTIWREKYFAGRYVTVMPLSSELHNESIGIQSQVVDWFENLELK